MHGCLYFPDEENHCIIVDVSKLGREKLANPQQALLDVPISLGRLFGLSANEI